MRRETECAPRPAGGFTLIEVIGALVIFSVGVLMVIQSSGALSDQMRYAARTSEIVVRAHEWVDSLEALPFGSLVPGAVSDTLMISGATYRREAEVSVRTAVLMDITVRMIPLDTDGPGYTATSYSAAYW